MREPRPVLRALRPARILPLTYVNHVYQLGDDMLLASRQSGSRSRTNNAVPAVGDLLRSTPDFSIAPSTVPCVRLGNIIYVPSRRE